MGSAIQNSVWVKFSACISDVSGKREIEYVVSGLQNPIYWLCIINRRENLCHRRYALYGEDVSAWDLTKVVRLPFCIQAA
jgi:hypothetical protein